MSLHDCLMMYLARITRVVQTPELEQSPFIISLIMHIFAAYCTKFSTEWDLDTSEEIHIVY